MRVRHRIMVMLPSGKASVCLTEKAGSSPVMIAKLRWLCQSPSGIDTETKRMGGYAAAARYSIVFTKRTLGGRVAGTIESGCFGNFQLESKSDKTQIDVATVTQSKGQGNKLIFAG